MRPQPLVSLFLCYLVALPSFGWWETGHRTVARVAAFYLEAGTRTRVAQLLGVRDTPDSVANAMAAASTWADESKEETQTGEWHYIDLARQDKEKQIGERCPEGNCVTERIDIFTKQLAHRTPTGISDRNALRYLIHFVADVHQPLHAISNADLGGNCERITPFNDAKNLHALWDGGIIASLHESDVRLADDLEGYISRLGGGEQRSWSKGDAKKWTWESHLLAEEEVYQRLHIPMEPAIFPKTCKNAPAEIASFRPYIDSLYINDMKPVVRDQLAKAGLRLARVLNQSLK